MNLREEAKVAKNKEALSEIKKIGNRRMNEIVSDPNVKNSVKKSARTKYRLLSREIKRRAKKL